VENRTRYISIRFRVSPEELRILEQKQQESRISNREAFIRKQIMEGQILILNVPEVTEENAGADEPEIDPCDSGDGSQWQ